MIKTYKKCLGFLVTLLISLTVWTYFTRLSSYCLKVENLFGLRSEIEDIFIAKAEPVVNGGDLNTTINLSFLYEKAKVDPKCKDVAQNPSSYWRSQPSHTTFTSEIDQERVRIAFGCGLLYPEFMNTPPIPTLYDFEKFYLQEPPAQDIRQVSNERFSVVTSVNSSNQFRVGETAAFLIEIKDGRGIARTKGGDHIRVWFEDVGSGIKIPGNVEDLNNGSYLATGYLPHTAKLRLKVALAYPREYIRALVYLQRIMKTFRVIVGFFNNTQANETTPCYHTQVIPGFPPSEQCNLTSINGSPWFCGLPIKPLLSCRDYKGTMVPTHVTNVMPATDVEMELFRRSARQPYIRYIKTDLVVHVVPDSSLTPPIYFNERPSTPCNKLPARETWNFEKPTGFMKGNEWIPYACHIQKIDAKECLSNVGIFILGDSNGRAHYGGISSMTGCTHIKKALTTKWHKPLLCVDEQANVTVRWEPHTNPFMNGGLLAELGSLYPSDKAIDEIPSHGRYIIILNHFFHITTFHTSAMVEKFKTIRDSLIRLLKRNPNVKIVLQGPHIAWVGWPEHFAAGDMLGRYIMALQKEIFKDILDDVVFFNTWDMTLAVTNHNFHPSINAGFKNTILAYVCGR